MNCDELRRTVLLEDDDLRPDTAGLKEHYARCAHCRSAFPELALVLPAAPPTLARREHARVAAAAALLLCAALALHRHAIDPKSTPVPHQEPDRSRPMAYTLVVENSVAQRDRVTTFTLTHQAHPTPRRNP